MRSPKLLFVAAFLLIAPTGVAQAPDWAVGSDQAWAQLGLGAAFAGDTNGDGFNDAVVGAPGYTNDQADEGRAWLYLGSTAGLNTVPAWTAEGDQVAVQGAEFGSAIAGVGDVNGDGLDDVLIGAFGHDGVDRSFGRAYLYAGTVGGLSQAPVWIYDGSARYEWLGFSVAGAGDVNGDGFCDVLVGAPGFRNSHVNEGRALVFHGSAVGPSVAPAWVYSSNQEDANLGLDHSVAGVGDLDGDGFDDVVVGAPFFDAPDLDEGRIFLFPGSSSGLLASPSWTAEGDQTGSGFGRMIAPAGDVNGDGLEDFIIGNAGYRGAASHCGRAMLFQGSPSGPVLTWQLEGEHSNEDVGSAVGSLDFNGDGLSDVVVTRYGLGKTELYYGTPSGLGSEPAGTLTDGETDSFGWSIALGPSGRSDVNGDGFSDLLLGMPFGSDPEEAEGRAFLYHGARCGVQFMPFGEGLAGSAGIVPLLSAAGGMCWQTGFSLQIDLGLGGAPGVILIGIATADRYPFFGGHLYVDFAQPWFVVPIVLGGVPGLAGSGFLTIPSIDVRTLPSLTLYLQVALRDDAAVEGVSLTNALALTVSH